MIAPGDKRVGYVAWPLAIVSLGFVLSRARWHGTAELHTLLETIAAVLQIVAGSIALKGYYSTKGARYLLLGNALVGAGCLAGCHTLITSSVLSAKIPAASAALAGWSEMAPLLFLAMLLALLPPSLDAATRLVQRIGVRGVYALVGVSVVVALVACLWAPYAAVLLEQGLSERASELLAGLFFAVAALRHIRKGDWVNNGFEHWFILSLITGASGQLPYNVFASSYDASFFGFHVIKILSNMLMLAALFSSVSAVYRSEAEAVLRLRCLNEVLGEEISERRRIAEELRRARDEEEMRVRERTADLEKQSFQLKAAHAETELFLTAIPSILFGLDSRGRITRWNPTASQAFGISAQTAIGRTLDDCGIRWVGFDIRDEVSQWMLTKSLYRSDVACERNGSVRSFGFVARPIPGSLGNGARVLVTGTDTTERRRAEAAMAHLGAIVESSEASIVSTDLEGAILTWNPAAERIYGYSADEAKGRSIALIYPEDRLFEMRDLLQKLQRGEGALHIETVRVRKNGKTIPIFATYSPLRDASGRVVGSCSIATDITERKLLERQLAQAQKLESIGQLAAGIAHEINTPIQYVSDNLCFVRESFAQLETLFQGYDRLLARLRSQWPETPPLADIDALAGAIQENFLRTELPHSIEDALDGAGRVTEIVRAIKEFSHPGPFEKTPLDINRAIESTVLVSRNEWKYVADLQTELDATLPPVICMPGEFNQVILNLIVNAAHAVADVVAEQPGTKGTITVTTRRDGEWAEIRVRDTGTGIPEEIQPSIFNPFFTTKGVGRGTGQGLAIAHSVVVQKHGGTISFDTAVGAGTTFRIRLPIGELAA